MNTTDAAEDLTLLIRETAAGDKNAEVRLLELAHGELLRRARYYLARERPDHTLQATALVNEMYLRLSRQLDREWKNRHHFYGVAAQLMRHVLVDHARRHKAPVHGGDLRKVSLDENCRMHLLAEGRFETLLALDSALKRLSNLDPRAARVVELRFFGDLTVPEAAIVIGMTEDAVKEDWQFARAWLLNELRPIV